MQKSKDLDFKIFKELKETNNYLSGQNIANKLKISRQAFWKHIKNLNDCGYKIEAIPRRGYKLKYSPDKPYPWEIRYKLGTKFTGHNVYFKEKIDSTQDFIWQLGQAGAPEGTVVLAGKQKKGKGRIGREWVSPKGGLYLSCLLRPKKILLKDISQIALVIALACIQAIEQETGIRLSVKWPNDIFLNKKKLGGILCQINAEADKINFVAIGLGININTKNLPEEATSLFLERKNKVSLVAITKKIIGKIEQRYLELEAGKSKELLEQWQEHCFLWGNRLRVKVFDKVIEGEAAGIDQEGYLLVRRDNGLTEKISSGDVTKVM
ncbi:MAG: biotin--[acetyl-CoA-carboxylase] ligase [Candidatus Omnitrophica bacterium]|nr:biotin--[acetyl-CoA-carboxylase] ligase [Candidatus Omnitrophota bacterium]MCF7878893.1 biotin--[acetyl-CoA-carboxylase] ligase [Candidatus Omnitrophota bacterium]MCF7891680.1 biotin--[acetyl-CoA-carboxylase] ligase [Candidatus Omnitrophota bacterium]MCF7895608.1 biotin--[acetyl-CoA-carboxylase] ligase [Candidatus Omnitrophota bacterium]MCF7897301.1 biotin--[acetyl-CoA-carboxylase] ligase [Candidatus Omnitrophota bacterium]